MSNLDRILEIASRQLPAAGVDCLLIGGFAVNCGSDPMGERGGLNLYGFVEKQPAETVDSFGLSGCAGCASKKARLLLLLRRQV